MIDLTMLPCTFSEGASLKISQKKKEKPGFLHHRIIKLNFRISTLNITSVPNFSSIRQNSGPELKMVGLSVTRSEHFEHDVLLKLQLAKPRKLLLLWQILSS